MSEHLLPLSGPMVIARREGLKTQTRRVITSLKGFGKISDLAYDDGSWSFLKRGSEIGSLGPRGLLDAVKYKPGDTVAFREAFRISESVGGRTVKVHYRADCSIEDVELSESEWRRWLQWGDPFGGKPGRFMFRSLCRDRAKILDVRIQHVQEITEEDARAEGVNRQACGYGEVTDADITADTSLYWSAHYVDGFRMLWDSINAARGYLWESNPVVVALTFMEFVKCQSS